MVFILRRGQFPKGFGWIVFIITGIQVNYKTDGISSLHIIYEVNEHTIIPTPSVTLIPFVSFGILNFACAINKYGLYTTKQDKL